MIEAEPKKLFTHACYIMEKLDQNAIGVEIAKAQSSLIKQATNILRYQFDVRKFDYQLGDGRKEEGETKAA